MRALVQFLHRFQKYLKNTSWILGEKIIGMGVAFGVAILVARYFGPELFGIWSYALSLVGLFAIAGHMGLSGLAVREGRTEVERIEAHLLKEGFRPLSEEEITSYKEKGLLGMPEE